MIMALQLILGSAGSGKSHYIYEKIIRESMEKPTENFLILVPDQFTMQTQIEMASRHPRKGLLNIDVSSFTRLAHRLFMETGYQVPPVLEDMGKTMVLKRVAQKKKDELHVLGRKMQRPGYIREAKSMLSEFMQYDVSPGDLENIGQSINGNTLLREKLKDMEILYRGFEEFLSEHYVTSEEILDLLCRVIPLSSSMKGTTVVLDGFTGFTPIQNRLIGALLRHCPQVYITLTLDDGEDPFGKCSMHRLSYMTKKTIRSLCQLAREEKVFVDEPVRISDSDRDRYGEREDLRFLKKQLFRFERKVFADEPKHIQTFTCDNPAKEMEEVSRRISRLVREKEYRYRDIAVITGDLETYGWEARQAFEKAGIPCFVDSRRTVLSNPLAEAIRAILDMESSSFSYESVFRYLRSGISDLTEAEIDELENYCLALGIKGRKTWENRFFAHSQYMDPARVPVMEALRLRIMEKIGPFTEAMHAKDRTVGRCCRALYDLLVSLHAQQQMEGKRQQFEQRGELVLAREYAQMYRSVMDLMDKMVEILGDEPISLRDFAQLMDEGLSELRIGIIPPTADQVLVGDVERTRVKAVKALFFVGVNDQVIPGGVSAGGLLSENDRDTLASLDMELAPSPREAMFIQKFYLYLHLTKPSEMLTVSYAVSSAKGEQTGPAYLFGTLTRLFPELRVLHIGSLKNVCDMENRADAKRLLVECMKGLSPELFTEETKELLAWFLGQPDGKRQIDRLVKAAASSEHPDMISQAAARALYGDQLMNSVSRIERYAACAYAHFLQYGLRLKEREEYTFRTLDLGIILHACVETFGNLAREAGYTLCTVPEEKEEELIHICLEQVMETYGNQILLSTARNRYMAKRVEKLLRRSIWAIKEELKDSDFEPAGFEVSFDSGSFLDSMCLPLSEDDRMYLMGKIDRIDLYSENGQILVRIVDYKSGSKSFDLEDFYYGLQLQLILYLKAAMEMQQKEHPHMTVEPAAMLYYQMKDPLIEKNEGTNLEDERLKELKMSGLVSAEEQIYLHLDRNLEPGCRSRMLPMERKKDGALSARSSAADARQFAALTEYAAKKAVQIGREILQGKAEKNPYQKGERTACDFCAYSEACGFDTRLNSCSVRPLRKQNKDWLWQEILDGRVYDGK